MRQVTLVDRALLAGMAGVVLFLIGLGVWWAWRTLHEAENRRF